MIFNVITLFPQMITQALDYGVVGQAKAKSLIQVNTLNPRDFTQDLHKTVDDRPFGGGDGMVMLVDPLEKAVQSIATTGPVIYLSPQGKKFTDKMALEFSKLPQLTLLSGRYGGVDQRFLNKYVSDEVSIGDYVLSGGELAALVMIDAISRKLEGVLGHKDSAFQDSFADGLLEAPLFTRPQTSLDQEVPAILLGGHHAKIQDWRKLVGILVSLQKRPDLVIQNFSDVDERQKVLKKAWELYCQMPTQERNVLGLHLQERDFHI